MVAILCVRPHAGPGSTQSQDNIQALTFKMGAWAVSWVLISLPYECNIELLVFKMEKVNKCRKHPVWDLSMSVYPIASKKML